jgi:MurNAc alpha-1-phosphate uridylyltransferase
VNLPIAILAGGLGTRLGAVTRDIPKILVEVNRTPFAIWQLELLKAQGFTRFVYCVSHLSELIIELLKDGKEFGVSIEYSHDGINKLGTGGAIKKALPLLGSKFAVIYGDSYLPAKLESTEEKFIKSGKLGLLTLYKNGNLFDKSNIDYFKGGILKYSKVEKTASMKYIDYGFLYFDEKAFRDYSNTENFDLSDILSKLVEQNQMEPFEVYERFYEVGSKLGIQELAKYLRENKNGTH